MSTLFQQEITVVTDSGSYVRGEYTPGTPVTSTFLGGVQPLPSKAAKELRESLAGREDVGRVYVYSSTALKVGIRGTSKGAVVTWQGCLYEIIKDMSSRMGVIDHFKYVAEYVGEST